MFDVSKLGERIKHHRIKAGLSQSALGEKLNVSFQAVSSWETGDCLPDLQNLYTLATIFGVSMESLLSHDEDAEKILIAIDGGGTKTEVALFTQSGHILKNFKLKGTNATTIGIDNALEIHSSAIELCLKENKNVSGVFIGCAGGYLDEIKNSLNKKFPQLVIFVESDALNAFSSADADVALICGTGSILLRKEKEKYICKGGWGHKIGDPASAYNFGLQVMRNAFAYEDGLNASELMYVLLEEKIGPIRNMHDFKDKTVSKIASFASIVFAAYKLGDSFASSIIDCEICELSKIIRVTANMGERIVLCGGIIEHYKEIVLPALENQLGEYVNFVLPKLPPIYGAARECMCKLGIKCDEGFESVFEKDYKALLSTINN